MDPNAGTGTDPLRVIGDTNGDVVRAWAAMNALHHGRNEFHEVHRLRPGLVVATGVSSAEGHSRPIEVPLLPKDGAWQRFRAPMDAAEAVRTQQCGVSTILICT